jgi:hypothetical protein
LRDTVHEPEHENLRPHDRAVRALLLSDAVCEDIAIYLHHHRSAVDTARGVAEWWIDRDPRSTENALSKLLEHGVVKSYAHGSVRIYGYTKDREVRRAIAAYVKASNGRAEKMA